MWREIWEVHKGKCLGLIAGILLGFIYLAAGFWDMLIFAFIVFIGYYVGKRLDQGLPFPDVIELWRRLTERWRMFR
jgi:uncharacterized membrane protein